MSAEVIVGRAERLEDALRTLIREVYGMAHGLVTPADVEKIAMACEQACALSPSPATPSEAVECWKCNGHGEYGWKGAPEDKTEWRKCEFCGGSGRATPRGDR